MSKSHTYQILADPVLNIPEQIFRDAKKYKLSAHTDYECYQLVYDKRVIDPTTIQTYPYGYQPA